jgi:hypothetical protein
VLQTAQRIGSATGQTVLGTVFFALLGSAVASRTEGMPASEVGTFADALSLALIVSLVFSGAALTLGLVDLRRKATHHRP